MDLQISVSDCRTALSNFQSRVSDFEISFKDHLSMRTSVGQFQVSARKTLTHLLHEVSELKKITKLSILDEEECKKELSKLNNYEMRFDEMLSHLPCENNGIYLNIILGNISVSILNRMQRIRYKEDYEKFKLRVNLILFVFAPIVYFVHLRVLDAAYNFFLVWYYCTLTIRESILRCNGSRIKGWWLFHHYASAVLSGIMLTWPDGECYQNSRKQILLFSFYISFVTFLQCQYQRGCLYRLKALGRRHSMDITVEGFHTWMFRGLTFLLPFLIIGYVFQLYNAYLLYHLSQTYQCREWQVSVLALVFLLMATGNTLTTAEVCFHKVRHRLGVRDRLHFSLNVILYQRSLYEISNFERNLKYDLPVLICKNDVVEKFFNAFLSQMKLWFEKNCIKKITCIICKIEDRDVLECWHFRISLLPADNFEKKQMQSAEEQLRIIVRKISTVAPFLPVLPPNCSFDCFAYTDCEVECPDDWSELKPKTVTTEQMINLGSFNVGFYSIDLTVCYK
ncbi:Transmembrane protein [Trichinella patagoniensis]|uniref:Transmembrane protein n=1 Tax=Trichinella patagoniensis TaxID=990121 RepID=A0A0V1AAW9_9BILA|nr:Transmembrane protein [Trichinella sp. T9]KRY21960.1 Transmembrane protein [Trichinella patagoniensis]